MVLVNLAFHMRQNFPQNYLQFGHANSESSTSTVVGWESLKNIGMKGCQILACPGYPRVSGRHRVKILCISSDTSVCEVMLLVRG
jgi:hypothetical protein